MRHLLKVLIALPVCLFTLSSMLSTDAKDLGDVALKCSLLKTLIALPVCLLTLAWLYPPAGEDAGAMPARPARARKSHGNSRFSAVSWSRRQPQMRPARDGGGRSRTAVPKPLPATAPAPTKTP